MSGEPTRSDIPGLATRRLGQLFVAEGLIGADQLTEALAEQAQTGEKLAGILIRRGLITEDQLVDTVSRTYGIPAVPLRDPVTDSDLRRLVPAQIARKYEIIPLERTSGSLTLAMVDPTNLPAIDDVTFMTGLRVVPVIAPQSAIRRAIEQFYRTPLPHRGPPSRSADAEAEAPEIEVLERPEQGGPVDFLELRASAEQAPVVRLVNGILLDGLRQGASDIHLESCEQSFRIRLRIDGILNETRTLPKRLEPAIVSRIKVMADLDISERRLAQDGRVRLRHHGEEVDLRISTIPMICGESVSIRVLDKGVIKLDLTQLGFDPWSLEQFQRAIRSPYGMVLITGPTGSGKTTTLCSAIQTLNSPDVNIMTVEDPVEYRLEGVNQVPVNEEIGRSFASVLRSFLRHDPDVILVGEMRDAETAHIAIRAALTGHLVLTTLHTNDCASSVARLLDMGIPSFLVSSSLRLVVAQRLVRRICPACKATSRLNEESLIPYGHIPREQRPPALYEGKGCAACNFAGMRGRIAIYEVMPVSQEIRELISRTAPASEIREMARQQGMKTLREAGLVRVLDGLTTLDEVLRVTE